MQKDSGKPKTLRHTATQAGDKRFAFVSQVYKFQNLVADFPASFAAHAIRRGEELEILDNLHVVVHAEKVWHEPDDPANLLRFRIDRHSANVSFSPRWLKKRGKHFHRRRLTRAVRTDEAEQIAFFQFERKIFQGKEFAILLRELFRFNHAYTVAFPKSICSLK